MMKMLLSGAVLGFVASPTCPSNAEEIKQGTQSGFWAAVMVGLGAVTGDAIVLAAVLLGLMPLVESSEVIRAGLWLLGGFVLLYVSRGIFLEAKTVSGVTMNDDNRLDRSHRSLLKAFWVGAAITTFNPFTGLWWIGLLSPMLNDGSGSPVVFALAVLIGAWFWFALLAVLLHMGRRWLSRRPRQWLLVISGLVVLGYGLYFFVQFIREVV